MKKLSIFLILLATYSSKAQVVELAKLASGSIISSRQLYDNDKDDLYGYFYIFSKDKTSKTENLLEYVLLDKNLNKVCSGEFKYEYYDKKGTRYIYSRYMNGYIFLNIYERNSKFEFYPSKYWLLDVKENKLSDVFTLGPNLRRLYGNPDKNYAGNIVSDYSTAYKFGYTLTTPLRTFNEVYKSSKTESDNQTADPKRLYLLNEKLDTLWSYKYNQNATPTNYTNISFPYIDYNKRKDVIVLSKNYSGKENEKKIKKEGFNTPYIILDTKNGKTISEITPNESTELKAKEVYTKKLFISSDNSLVLLRLTMDSLNKKNTLKQDEIQGFSRAEYDITTGKEVKRSYFTWKQLSAHLNIDENGYVKEDNEPNTFMYLHDVVMKSNGNMIFILEQYKPLSGGGFVSPGGKVNDLIFFELDKDMKLVQFKRIEKEKKTLRVGYPLYGKEMDDIGGFDYTGFQDMGNNNYTFFYYNKQKPEEGGKKQWMLGIVSYTDGKFTEQKLPLKSQEGSDLLITPAKKGYVMIYETFKDKNKSSEIRLEKIN